jgi:hypothetical protein
MIGVVDDEDEDELLLLELEEDELLENNDSSLLGDILNGDCLGVNGLERKVTGLMDCGPDDELEDELLLLLDEDELLEAEDEDGGRSLRS